MAQGQDGSVRQLWQTFRSESRVVLLGAGAFWEGTIPLERPPACIVIARVPFPALSDPLLAARADTWDDQQNQFVVPHAALKLRQSLGGLAWSHWRRNAVVLFDRRLQTRGYGPTILGTLPRCTPCEEPAAQIVECVEEWVR
jgi:Rad3-related DNA helicase